jgi:pimeloyl-ACP methyl ester carboxylesterase
MKTALKVVGVLLGLVILVPLLAGLVMKGLAADEPPPGQLVDVGGHKLHIYCTGTDRGLPPVLIEAGLGLNSAYYHWIQTKLARSTKVCSYDRAGLGWSEESNRPRELGDVVEQLHILLDATDFERPFVFAGHSIGAIILREYVARHPDEVAGLAFLDGSHPDQTRALGLESLYHREDTESGLKMYRLMVRLGLSHLYDPSLTPMKSAYPESIFSQLQYTADGSYFDAVLAEYDGLVPYTNRARPEDTFGDRPTVVIQSGKTWDQDMLPDTVDAARLSTGWPILQKETAALSTRGRYVAVENATHMSLVYDEGHANEAAELIGEVLQETQASKESPEG